MRSAANQSSPWTPFHSLTCSDHGVQITLFVSTMRIRSNLTLIHFRKVLWTAVGLEVSVHLSELQHNETALDDEILIVIN